MTKFVAIVRAEFHVYLLEYVSPVTPTSGILIARLILIIIKIPVDHKARRLL
jgi:hypothetical protein